MSKSTKKKTSRALGSLRATPRPRATAPTARVPREAVPDQKYFEASSLGWLIVTNRNKPLLYDGRLPMFWSRAVARRHLQPWMREMKCRIVRAVVAVQVK